MNSTSGISWKGKNEDEAVLFHIQGVDYDYIETMRMEVLMGRTFSKSSPRDTVSTIINEEAMKALGFENPVGEYLNAGEESYEIIGVVKNFHFKSVHDRIEPLLLYVERGDLSNMMVRIEGNSEEAVEHIEKTWKRINPDHLLSFSFLDEEFNNLYRSETQTGTIFRYFSGLAIAISCLGLFGLAAYTVEQKSKEYGIRKVFGASVSRLFYIASAEFLILVVIAFVISVPVAWYWMKHWLNGFAYHVELSWTVFALSGLIAVIIALLTVSYQAGKVGVINPAKTLRAE
jgi:ABC-type antimicrobial peptide transport system permease subunit